MLLSLVILSLKFFFVCGITTTSGTNTQLFFNNITSSNCSKITECSHNNCSRLNCSVNSHCLYNNKARTNCSMDMPCLNNNTLQANCSRDLSELKSQTYADVWKRFDSKGRLTRASIAAVIFLVSSVVISIFMIYKQRVDPFRRWQFRYKKHTGTGGPEDRIYMVERDETLTNDFDSIVTVVDETLVTDDRGFKELPLESNA